MAGFVPLFGNESCKKKDKNTDEDIGSFKSQTNPSISM